MSGIDLIFRGTPKELVVIPTSFLLYPSPNIYKGCLGAAKFKGLKQAFYNFNIWRSKYRLSYILLNSAMQYLKIDQALSSVIGY